EVEVFSNGRNVARGGKATQSSTGFGGDAFRAIDGKTSGNYSDGGQSHTEEGTNSPWWQVDLGAEYPIHSIVIWNRTDGNFSKRPTDSRLKVRATDRRTVYQQPNQPAPDVKVTYQVGGEDPERAVRRAAMSALTSVRGEEETTFKSLAKFLKDDADRHAAVEA